MSLASQHAIEVLAAQDDTHEEIAWRLAELHAVRSNPPGLTGVDPGVMMSCAVAREVIAAIDALAERRGVTRSALVRVGLALVLHRDAEWLAGRRS